MTNLILPASLHLPRAALHPMPIDRLDGSAVIHSEDQERARHVGILIVALHGGRFELSERRPLGLVECSAIEVAVLCSVRVHDDGVRSRTEVSNSIQ